ncbi:MAG: carbohydrate ABC transporter permease [Anaerolineae bacterium]
MNRLLRASFPYLLVAPAVALLFAVLAYPLSYSFWLSFHEWTLRGFRSGVPFVGLDNYIHLFSEPKFWRSMRVTILFMLGAISLEFILGMAVALLVNQNIRGRGVIRSLILLPMMTTNVVIGLGWRMMFSYDAGVINWMLSAVGIPPVTWLSSINMALPSLIIVDVWNTTSFVALILLAGLQALPEEPVEAALIDGASNWQVFRYITLPLLRPTILVALLWRIIDTFRIFDVVFTLTGGGPANATEVISLYTYRNGFQKFDLGFASAISYAMIAMMLIVAFVLFRLIGRTEQIF